MASRSTTYRMARSARAGNSDSVRFITLDEIVLSETLTNFDGQNILLHDSGDTDPERFFIFAFAEAIQFFNNGEIIQCDGTFKIVPDLFRQLYVVHARVAQITIPVFYILMENKSQRLYTRVFDVILSLTNAAPHRIITDFEIGAMNVLTSKYPDATFSGCFYHLQENNYKKLTELVMETSDGPKKMSQVYGTNTQFALDMRLFSALAFLPVERVRDGFLEVVEYLQGKYLTAVDGYIGYFQSTYVGDRIGATWGQPMFGIEKWNLHESVLMGDPRTNNAVEGHNHALRLLSPGSNLTIQRFLKLVKEDMLNSKLKLQEFLAGQSPPPQRRKYRELTKNVLQIVERIQFYHSTIDFLKAIAQIFTV